MNRMEHRNRGMGRRQLVCLSLVCTLCTWIVAACASASPSFISKATVTIQTQTPVTQTPTTQAMATSMPTSCPQSSPPTGIYYGDNGGFHDQITNYAVIAPTSTRPTVRYTLFAGAYKANPQQGIIIEVQLNSDPCASSAPGTQIGYHPTPTQHGAVTLTKIVGDTVTFTTAGGGSGTFNFVSGKFS